MIIRDNQYRESRGDPLQPEFDSKNQLGDSLPDVDKQSWVDTQQQTIEQEQRLINTQFYNLNDVTRTQINGAASAYSKTTKEPLRKFVEQYTILNEISPIIKDNSNIKVMDMACGDGYFARLIQEQYSDNINLMVGLDISDEMIAIAKSIEDKNPQGIEYIRSDVALIPCYNNPNFTSDYDIIVAAFLLVYAQNKSMLQKFCDTIYQCLKHNGKYISINTNICKDPRKIFEGHKKYGLSSTLYSKLINDNYNDIMEDGHRLEINRWVPQDPSICATFDVHYLSKATYEECFRAAGFSKWEWKPLVADPNYLKDDSFHEGYWDTLCDPIHGGIVCIILTK